MQFLTSLFGGSGHTIITAVLALGIVIVLIVLALWLLKILSKATSTAGRGRGRRLSVIEQLNIDPRRQLLIVRRDNVEHLILTGNAQDLVIETGIPVEPSTGRSPLRRPIPTVPRRSAPTTPDTAPAPADAATARPNRAPIPPRATPAARPASLRHTGLMRASERLEPEVSAANLDKYGHPVDDSARTDRNEVGADPHKDDSDGRAQGGADTQGERRDAFDTQQRR